MTFRTETPMDAIKELQDPTDNTTREFASTDPSKPPIEIRDVCIRASSHKFDPKDDYVGLIIYLQGGKGEFTFRGVQCKTGDIFIKKSAPFIKKTSSRDHRYTGMHGKLFRSIFGCWKNERMKIVTGSFSYHQGKWECSSARLYPNSYDDGYHNPDKKLEEFEKKMIKSVCEKFYVNHQWRKLPDGDRVTLEELFGQKVANHRDRKEQGIVSRVNHSRGYAMIECDDLYEDIFVLYSAVSSQTTRRPVLEVGDHVRFNLTKGQQGWQALNVTIDEQE